VAEPVDDAILAILNTLAQVAGEEPVTAEEWADPDPDAEELRNALRAGVAPILAAAGGYKLNAGLAGGHRRCANTRAHTPTRACRVRCRRVGVRLPVHTGGRAERWLTHAGLRKPSGL
jgi:hypothetical protein